MARHPLEQRYRKNTVVFEHAGGTTVRLYATDIVTFNDQHIILDTGGWETPTTKDRMNQTSQAFSLGFRVNQVRGKWYVNFRGACHEIKNGRIVLHYSQLRQLVGEVIERHKGVPA